MDNTATSNQNHDVEVTSTSTTGSGCNISELGLKNLEQFTRGLQRLTPRIVYSGNDQIVIKGIYCPPHNFDHSPIERILNHIREAFYRGNHNFHEAHHKASSVPFQLCMAYEAHQKEVTIQDLENPDWSVDQLDDLTLTLNFRISRAAEYDHHGLARKVTAKQFLGKDAGKKARTTLNRYWRNRYFGKTEHNCLSIITPMCQREIDLAMAVLIDSCTTALNNYFESLPIM